MMLESTSSSSVMSDNLISFQDIESYRDAASPAAIVLLGVLVADEVGRLVDNGRSRIFEVCWWRD
jgi:hypothetical protein